MVNPASTGDGHGEIDVRIAYPPALHFRDSAFVFGPRERQWGVDRIEIGSRIVSNSKGDGGAIKDSATLMEPSYAKYR